MEKPVALPFAVISLVTLLWAGNFAAGKIATSELDPLLIASVRIVLAALFFPLWLPRGTLRELGSAATWRVLLPLALTGIFLNQFAFATGIQRTTPAHSALVHALIPVFVVLIARVLHAEKPTPVTLVGMALAIGGAVYLAVAQSGAERDDTLVGDLLTLLGAVSFSAYVVLGRRVTATSSPYRAVSLGFVMAVPFSLPFLGWSLAHQDWSRVSWHGLGALGYMIVAATFVCYAGHMYAVSRLGALRVSVFTNLQPILATLLDLALFGRAPTLEFLAAGAVILAGVAIVQFPGLTSSKG